MSAESLKERYPPLQLVCVHGAGAGGWEWRIWSRVFAARGMPLHAPDLAATPAGLALTRFADYRQQVRDWSERAVSEYAESRLVLAGASLGGLLALSVAVDVQAAALILINPMPPATIMPRPPGHPCPAVLPWGAQRSLAGTRRAMPDADDAACLLAFRRWRDESGLALEQARLGITLEFPDCPILVLASERDTDVPVEVSRELAARCRADFESLDGCSHVGPLLGRHAGKIAEGAAAWLLARLA